MAVVGYFHLLSWPTMSCRLPIHISLWPALAKLPLQPVGWPGGPPAHGSCTFSSNSSASLFYFILAALEVCRTLVPQLGTEHGALTMEVQSPDHWCVCVCVCVRSVMSDSLGPLWTIAYRLFCSWDFPDKNTKVGCHFLF